MYYSNTYKNTFFMWIQIECTIMKIENTKINKAHDLQTILNANECKYFAITNKYMRPQENLSRTEK